MNSTLAILTIALFAGSAFTASNAAAAGCDKEIATSGCKGTNARTVQCIRGYQGAHADFMVSQECETAMVQMKANVSKLNAKTKPKKKK